MKKELNVNYLNIIKTVALEILVSAVAVFLFAAVMYFLELDLRTATLFGTLSIALGIFVAAFFASQKFNIKGIVTGLIIGLINFVVVLLISLFADKGAVTQNTLFHFIIFLLTALIGGIMGANRKMSKKYI